MKEYDALIIGGGFFGCMIAITLRQLGLKRVIVVEREDQIMRRATRFNQARIHRGYHYPRDSVSALASARHFHRFQEDFAAATRPDLVTHYCIARNSRVTPTQFEHFCKRIGIPLWSPVSSIRRLVDPDLIDEIYRVEETVFDCDVLMRDVRARLARHGVEVIAGTEVSQLREEDRRCRFAMNGEAGAAGLVINATYSAIDRQGIGVRTKVKREWVEVALIKPPADLSNTGITVMDGPFFSIMPFPSQRCHTLTHVRYTPHFNWVDPADASPIPHLGFGKSTQAAAMRTDAARYIPRMRQAEILGSFYEVKAVLAATEDSDARPILLEKAENMSSVYSVLGAKIDNIYDVLEALPALLNGTGSLQANQ